MRDWLKENRKAANMTLQQLADSVGVTLQSISYYESGERTPRPAIAKRIAIILGFNWTLFYKDEKTA